MRGAERWLDLDGRNVRYRDVGGGPTVVWVPGLGLSSDFYYRNYASFADHGFRVVAPDPPGFGKSDRIRRTSLSIPETADWLIGFADSLGLRRPAWLGHSISAQAVLDLAARHPDRAAALVLTSPTGRPGRFRRLHQVLTLAATAPREPLALYRALLRDYLRVSPLAYVGLWHKAARDEPTGKARRVQCPTLIVVGKKDPVVPRAFVELLAQQIRDARIAYVPGGAHGAIFDRATEFNRIAATFLREALV